MQSCPTVEQLRECLAEQGDVPEVVARHVEHCGDCQRLLEELTGGSAAPAAASTPLRSGPDPTEVSFGQFERAELAVEAWLRAYQKTASPDDVRPKGAGATDPPAQESTGAIIGPYQLVEVIGEGGMGTVWLAEQSDPIQRRAALKVVKEGMDTKQVLARFEAERQALALMDHPHIAKVLDAGRTPSGRPYFVMELVNGQPITKYCDQQRLGVRQRLELFADVCRAVQHAHQKGIIHRDLKPSNVLVGLYDGKALVKVIDFGLAKATGPRLTDKTLFTGFGTLLGTPEYMSPEQAEVNNPDIDTRSDIYSLGVLLYELLTGSTPLTTQRLNEATLVEVLRLIREEEPPRPSTRLREAKDRLPPIAAQRHTEPAKLTKLLFGELDWIVMKALEKDRNRRYQTANDFAQDVQHHLADEPVQACPPSAWYRLRKLVRRNKGKVAAAAAMLALVLGGTAASTWQAVRATRAEQRTSQALKQTREALDALTEDVVETMFAKQPELGAKEKEFLRKVLGFYDTFTQQSAQSPEAAFLRAKGYFGVAHFRALLGEHRDAEAAFRQAELLLEQLVAEFPAVAEYRQKLARTEANLGVVLAKVGKHADAETAFRRGIALYTELTAEFPDDLGYLLQLARNYGDFGSLRRLQHKYAEAEKNQRHALHLREKLVARAGDQRFYHMELSQGLCTLGELLRLRKKYAEAEKVLRRALKIQEEHMGKGPAKPVDRKWLALSYEYLGLALAELKSKDQAAQALRRGLELYRKLADDFPGVLEYRQDLVSATSNLARFLTLQGNHAAAVEPCRQMVELRKAIVARAGPVPAYRHELALSYHNLAWVHSVTGRPKEAEAAWRAALKLWQQLAIASPQVAKYQHALAGMLTNLAKLHNQRGEFKAAVALLEEARSHSQAALDKRPNDPGFRQSYRDHLVALAHSRLGLADHVRIATIAAEIARFGYEPAYDTYYAGGMLARCVSLAAQDASLPEAQRKKLATSYTQQALARLRQAVRRGFKDVDELKKNPDLGPLRSRAEFRELLTELEAKRKE
jgi:serine/threonine protein kinase